MAAPERVLLLEPSTRVRTVVSALLADAGYDVVDCPSVEQLVASSQDGAEGHVALAAWQSLAGLLKDDRRPELETLTRHLRLVLMVPRPWVRLLEQAELGLAGLLAKPFDRDELLDCLRRLD